MAHPFFDSVTYPWHRPEAVRLYKALYKVFDKPAAIDTEYKKCANGQDELLPLALGFGPDVIWKEALEKLTIYPDGLQKLCSQQFANAELKIAAEAVVNAPPFNVLRIITDNVVVIDRVLLREKIDLVAPDTSIKKVLLVRGGAKSGKSHARHLLHGAALDRGALFVYIDSGMVVTVEHAIKKLFSVLGALDRIPPTYTTDMAGYITVCTELLNVVVQKKQPLWIAVDDLGLDADNVPLLGPDIKEFFDQFALLMPDPSFAAWFRLMLIHYPEGKLPTKWRREILTEDRPSEADVQPVDVAEVLRSWSAINGRAIVEAELLELAAEVVANADAPPPPPPPGEESASRLQRINDELAKALSDLARQQP